MACVAIIGRSCVTIPAVAACRGCMTEPDGLSDAELIAGSADELGLFGELPEQQSTALRLRIADGLSYPEVAARLGCSEGAAGCGYVEACPA